MQKVLKLRVENLVSESEKEFEKLPKFQQNILIDIYNSNQTKDIINMTKEMKKVFKKEMKEVSPSEICNKINFKVFLMHGANDSMVPYTESIKLHKECIIFLLNLWIIMKIKVFQGGYDKNLCYLLWCEESLRAAIIDPSVEPLEIFEYIENND